MATNYTLRDIQKLLKAKAKAKAKGDLKDIANCCNVLGELFQQQGKYEDAIAEHEEEQKLCSELNDTLGIGIAHRKIGEALNELGKYEDALKHQNKYLNLAKSLDNKLEVQRALATMGRTHFCHAEALTTNNRLLYDGALSNSKDAYLKSLEMCKKIKNAVSEKDYMLMNSRLYLNLALVCDLQLQDTAAINYFKKAIYVTNKYNFKEDLHRCQYSLALFYQRRKNYSQAKREIEMAEKVAFQLKDKSLICDDLSLKAQLFVTMADYESARRYLLKAYRQKTPIAKDHEKIEADLRSAIRLCKLQDECCMLDSNNEEKLIKYYEKMGDLCSSLKAYSRALEFYLKVLNKAQEQNWTPKDINPIYVSISQTYMDLKDYKNAVVYYKKELEQYGNNPSEACRTILNIANALEEDGATYYELEPLYNQALGLASEAKNSKLEATALNSLAVLQEINGFLEKSQKTMSSVQRICAAFDIDLDDESEDSPSQTEKGDWSDGDIDVEELIDDDSDDEEMNSIRRRRCQKNNIEKLNMKGETALHRACIKQDMSLVRMLLQHKHKVNVRDNCGWTPLHEACNYGNIDIVKTLIEHGASVNDRGGKHCEGVTPLHDAASCGHIEVMDVLLQHGANPLAQTDAGESVYECLLKWRLRTGGDLDSQSTKECEEMEKKLANAMKKANQRVPSIKEVELKQSSVSALIPEEEFVEASLTRETSVPDDDYTPTVLRESTNRRSASTSAQREYEQAMKVIGSSSVRRSSAPLPSKRSRQIPALLHEDELDDIWLEDDLPSPTRKCAKRSNLTFPVVKHSYETDRFTPSPSSTTCQKSIKSKYCLSRQKPSTRLSQEPPLSDDDVIGTPASLKQPQSSSFLPEFSDESNDRPSSPIFTKKIKKPVQLSMDIFTESSRSTSESRLSKTHDQSPFVSHHSPSSNILKLYVRIQDKLLLIPVECNRTVRWLTEEAARRYNSMTGLNPILSLQTLEGAALNGDDIVSTIFRDGDKVIGEMLKWDLQSLHERYGNLCRQLESVRIGELDSLLASAHTSGKLSLNLPLGQHLLPVLKSLRYQDSLWDLDLSSSKLNDHLFQSLCEALSTLPQLISLNLRENLITAASISRLTEILRQDDAQVLKKLQTLDLSFNPLGDDASYPLASCLEYLPSLRSLFIEACELGGRSIEDVLSNALRTKQLRDIGIGWNTLQYKLKPWLEAVDLTHLERLSLAGLPSCKTVDVLLTCLQTTDKSRIIELDLSNCNITESCVQSLADAFAWLPNLKRLIMKNNVKVQMNAFELILRACQTYFISIEEIDLTGCGLCAAESCDPVSALQSFLASSKSLVRLSLSFHPRKCDKNLPQSIINTWITGHNGDGNSKWVTEFSVILSTSES